MSDLAELNLEYSGPTEEYVVKVTASIVMYESIPETERHKFEKLLREKFDDYKKIYKKCEELRDVIGTRAEATLVQQSAQRQPEVQSGGVAIKAKVLGRALMSALVGGQTTKSLSHIQSKEEQLDELEIELSRIIDCLFQERTRITDIAKKLYFQQNPGIIQQAFPVGDVFLSDNITSKMLDYCYAKARLSLWREQGKDITEADIAEHNLNKIKLTKDLLHEMLDNDTYASAFYKNVKDTLRADMQKMVDVLFRSGQFPQAQRDRLNSIIEALSSDEVVRKHIRNKFISLEIFVCSKEIEVLDRLKSGGDNSAELQERLEKLNKYKLDMQTELEANLSSMQDLYVNFFMSLNSNAIALNTELSKNLGFEAPNFAESVRNFVRDKFWPKLYAVTDATGNVVVAVNAKVIAGAVGAAVNMAANPLSALFAPGAAMGMGVAAGFVMHTVYGQIRGNLEDLKKSIAISNYGELGAKYNADFYKKPSKGLISAFDADVAQEICNFYTRHLVRLECELKAKGHLRDDELTQRYNVLRYHLACLQGERGMITHPQMLEYLQASLKLVATELLPQYNEISSKKVGDQLAYAQLEMRQARESSPTPVAIEVGRPEMPEPIGAAGPLVVHGSTTDVAALVPSRERFNMQRSLTGQSGIVDTLGAELNTVLQLARCCKNVKPEFSTVRLGSGVYVHEMPVVADSRIPPESLAILTGDLDLFRRYFAESLMIANLKQTDRQKRTSRADHDGNTVLHYLVQDEACFNEVYERIKHTDCSGVTQVVTTTAKSVATDPVKTTVGMSGSGAITLVDMFDLTIKNNAGKSAVQIIFESGNKVMMEKVLDLIRKSLSHWDASKMWQAFDFVNEDLKYVQEKSSETRSMLGQVSKMIKDKRGIPTVSDFDALAKILMGAMKSEAEVLAEYADVADVSVIPSATTEARVDPNARTAYQEHEKYIEYFNDRLINSLINKEEHTLLQNILQGDFRLVDGILKQHKATINKNYSVPDVMKDGTTTLNPLQLAVKLGLTEVVTTLLNHGASYPKGQSAFLDAARLGYQDMMLAMLANHKNKIDLKVIDGSGNSALHYIIINRDPKALAEYLSFVQRSCLGGRLDFSSINIMHPTTKEYPLHLLARAGDDGVKMLEQIQNYVKDFGYSTSYTLADAFAMSASAKDKYGKTPLDVAVECGNVAFITRLGGALGMSETQLSHLQARARAMEIKGSMKPIHGSVTPPSIGPAALTPPPPGDRPRIE